MNRLISAAVAALACSAVAATPAHAIKVQRIYAGPIQATSQCNPEGSGALAVSQAAAVSDFCFALRTEPTPATGDHLKVATIDAPAGVLANVDSAPKCSPAAFAVASGAAVSCGAETQVGAASADIRAKIAGSFELPLAVPGQVYNLEHTNDEVGLLGIQLNPDLIGVPLPKVKVLLRFTLRPAPDVGLRAVADDLPTEADTGILGVKPIAVDTFGFRFWGSREDHPTMPSSFARLGSRCGTATTGFSASSYAGDSSALTQSYEATGCELLRLGQTATVTTSERRPDVPAETVVELRPEPAADPDRLEVANPAGAVVTLPPGLMLGAQAASGPQGLSLCPDQGFDLTSNAPALCPQASAVATVRLASPDLAAPFVGSAYLGTQRGPNRLPSLLITADQGGTAPDAARIKLVGELTVDSAGRLVATLPGIPDVPFSSFALTFRGGEHGVLSTPRSCGTHTGTSELVAPSQATPSSIAPLALSIDQDCAAEAFSPVATVALATPVAGAEGMPTVTLSRPDRTARLGAASVHLPPGLLASLKGVPECSGVDAAAGSCPETSRVGTVGATAGVGPAPTATPSGALYLTAAPTGAVAGLVFVAPVAFGEVNLGRLVIAARVDLRQSDYGLDLSATLPPAYLGLPLNLRSFSVALDRPGFSKNPTSCAPLAVAADITSDLGSSATPSAALQMTGCGAVSFAPQISASVSHGTVAGSSAGIDVDVALPGLQSGLARVKTVLPAGIGVDLSRLGRACPVADFRSSGCHADATIGSLTGSLDILDEPMDGRALLVTYPGESLPGIGLDIAGRFAARLEGHSKVESTGRLSVTLDHLPDAPITHLAISLAPGEPSVLKASRLYCATGRATFNFATLGQSGAALDGTVDSACIASADPSKRAHRATIRAKLTARASTHRPTLTITARTAGARRLIGYRVTLADGMSVRRAGFKKHFSAPGGRILSASGRTIRVAFRGAGRRKATATLGVGTLQLTPRLRRSTTKLKINLLLRYADGTAERRTVHVR